MKSRRIKLDPKTLLPADGRVLTEEDLFSLTDEWKSVSIRPFLKHNHEFEALKLAFPYMKNLCKESNRKRKDRRGEIIHCYRVTQMFLLFSLWHAHIFNIDAKRIIKKIDRGAALAMTHDSIEDFKGVFREISQLFGFEFIWDLLKVTKFDEESSEDYFSRVFSDELTILVKVFDRLHNTKNMIKYVGENDFFTSERIAKQNIETREFILPKLEMISKQKKGLMYFAFRVLKRAVENSERDLCRWHIAQGRMN